MGNSFQDQFLKLGLVDKKQVSKVKKQKHQKKKQKSAKKHVVVDENALLAQEALAKKKVRAQELNRQREEKLKKREVTAAIKQMVEKNKLEKDANGVAYRFNDLGKIQRMFVKKEMADQLSSGQLGIVGFGNSYEVVSRTIAEKIKDLSDKTFILTNKSSNPKELESDDPYSDFEVPDDLMW